MPILLNGEVVPVELVLSEEQRLRETPQIRAIQHRPDFQALAAPSPSSSGPVASVQPTSIQFAAQPPGAVTRKAVTIQNTGSSPLHISSISIDNPVFTLDIYSECNIGSAGGISPSFSCQVIIGFAPTFSGRYTATLTIVDDAPDSPQTVPITGTATGIEIQPNRLKFHLVQPGQTTAPKTATVTNWGSVPIAYIQHCHHWAVGR